ncbi:MAG: amidohydrolase [Elusimicrobia bacterium]|nr:amidohydrolase [Elusimicrobiota bacterium]
MNALRSLVALRPALAATLAASSLFPAFPALADSGGALPGALETSGGYLRASRVAARGASTMADPVPARVRTLSDAVTPEVVAWRRDFHMHPEVSNRETRTAARLAEILKGIGVDELKTGVAHHGLVALIRGARPGPTIALRAEMDGLPIQENTGLPFASKNPNVMHACGHDAHMAMLLGAAKVLAQMKDELHGSVKLIFQPAEEGVPMGEEGGAELMIRQGVLDNPKVAAVFAMHANALVDTGEFKYSVGPAMASLDRFRVTVKGRGAHGAMPWLGVDPVYVSSLIVAALQSIASRENDARNALVVTVGSINGGNRFNIIPDQVVLEGSIRALDADSRAKAIAAFERIVTKTAEAHGGSATVEWGPLAYPMVLNEPSLTRQVVSTLEGVVGAGKVVNSKPVTTSEDFAFFSAALPSAFVFLGVRSEAAGSIHGSHTPRFVLDEAALPYGVRSFAMQAIDYLRTRR